MELEKIEAYWADPAREAELVAAIARLVAVPSERGVAQENAPFGAGPKAALEEGLKLCKELGFKAENYENYVGLCDLNDQPTALHILGHLDVVGAGSGWRTDPFTCTREGDLLFGRGVSDDKGPVVAALLAMKAVRELGLPLTHNARLILGTDEESGSEDLDYYYAREPYAPFTFTPDADFPLINTEKGMYRPNLSKTWAKDAALPRVTSVKGGFLINVVAPTCEAVLEGLTAAEVTPVCAKIAAKTGAEFACADDNNRLHILCTGRGGHAAVPAQSNSANTAMLALLAGLPLAASASQETVCALHTLFPHGDHAGAALGVAQSDALSGELTLTLSLLDVTETNLAARFDARVPVCATDATCKAVATESFARFGIAAEGEMIPPHHTPADAPIVKTLLGCYSAFTGEKDPQPLAIGGGTYVHHIPGGVAFGCDFPDFDPKMHAAGEQASVKNLILSCKIFTAAIAELCQ